MANTDTPMGLRPVRHRNGAAYNGASNPYYLPSGYATAVFIGDCVTKTGTSNTALVTVPGGGAFPIATLPEINRTTAGDSNTDAERITGVVVGFSADPTALENKHNPASTERVAYVCDDPDVIFEVQADNAIAATEISLNAILIDAHSGDTNTGMSGTEIDGGSSVAPAADASYQVLIMRGVNRDDNEMNLVHNKVEVMINVHTEAHGMNTNAIGTLGI